MTNKPTRSALPLDKIITGDCLEVMNSWPEKSIKCIVTSPPYNLLASSSTMRNPRHANAFWAGAKLADGYDGCADSMPHDHYVEWQRACLHAMRRLLRDDGVIFYNHK
ncbi:MAG: DNA methyltransferase, partial [Pseudomonadota bacterium]